MSDKSIIPIICGPTASGKTALSYHLINALNRKYPTKLFPIISADSRQIYKNINIGTAKPSKKELSEYKYYFIDIKELNEEYSSGTFAKEAFSIIEMELQSGSWPIICGGTGFYIKSLIEGLDTDGRDESAKSDFEKSIEGLSKDELYDKLIKIDLESAKKFSDMNPVRVKRALEYHYQTGQKFSEMTKREKTLSFEYIYIIPDYVMNNNKRDILYDRINSRCEYMWENGIVEETKYAIELLNINLDELIVEDGKIIGLPNSLNTVGYKEVILFLKGMDKSTAIELFKRNTRRYAKRQMTWFRRVAEENKDNTLIIDYDDSKAINIIIDRL